MIDSVLVLGWDRAIPGREGDALELFTQVTGWLAKQQQAGGIASFEPVILSAHGGDLNGLIIIRGERTKIDALRANDEFLTLQTRATLYLKSFGAIPGWTGDGHNQQMQRWGKTLQTLKK
jgi:hypothetical protein